MSYQLKKIDLRKKNLQCEFCGMWFSHDEKKLSRHIKKCRNNSIELLDYLKKVDVR